MLNGDVFDFAGEAQHDAVRILDAHPRLASALERFVAGEGRHMVFLVGASDHDLATPGSTDAVGLRATYGADIAMAADLRIATGAGERIVRVEHGSRFGTDNDSNDEARAEAERLIGEGHAGLVTGSTHNPELIWLGDGFYANTGSGGVVVRSRSRRWGLPPVSIEERQLSWVELEAGADLHARLLYSRVDISDRSLGERITVRPNAEPVPKPVVVSAFPGGSDWPAPVYAGPRAGGERVDRLAPSSPSPEY